MYFLGGLLWLVASWFVARLITGMLIHWTKWAKNELLRGADSAALLPVVFMAPLADEIVGKVQFDRLCEVAKEVKIYGTVPVGRNFIRETESGDHVTLATMLLN